MKALNFGARRVYSTVFRFQISGTHAKKKKKITWKDQSFELLLFPSFCIIYSVIQYGVLDRCLKLGSFLDVHNIHTRAHFGVTALVSFVLSFVIFGSLEPCIYFI